MRSFHFLLTAFTFSLFCGAALTASSPKALSFMASEAVGMAVVPPSSVTSLLDSAHEVVKSAGLGYGSTCILNELQNLQSQELEGLLASQERI
ncbi:hypothetical protein C6H88_00925 [Chlamydia muridarum str. Nigg]|jgi:hypothetical protein|uniref:Outer membrane protein n=2 Tax=Chlamydia muridarum TaxID=83560 RepID=A0A069ZWH3_CHLMR|nr:hypothetical protein [Chlamydia muridarum]UFW26288.1 hypothetical protein FTM98_01010 [Chlamydia trachomatis]AAF39050.1 conserved hypothetical protein [Chlamydia muridarum str. Nigg]AHH22569.1 hypothetical protein TAC_00935 [Chlamydia muridarum str. Nigg3 CMUT3-5]AHH23493.1 hypothetical protein Y015_00935 [Chlamydia muridarum str. Nigg CM972]AID37716.1 hypothetical protein BB17_00955 [Chlamydia muridarum str. Nigg 2 MCR]